LWRFRKVKFMEQDIVEITDRHLEAHHALHCATKGISDWPGDSMLKEAQRGFKINFKAFALPLMGGLCALMLAKLWPLSQVVDLNSQAINSWQMKEIDKKIEHLKEDEHLDELVLKKWEKESQDLKNTTSKSDNPAALLEAGDRMESQIKNSVSKVESVLEKMSSQVALLKQMNADGVPQHLKSAQDKRLSELMKQAKNMQLSWSPPSDCQKPGQESNGMKSFDQDQLEKLSKSLEDSLSHCQSCLGKKKGRLASGKPSKGASDADMSYGKPSAPLSLNKMEALPEAKEMRLGEKLETQYRAPEKGSTSTTLKATGQKALDSDQASGVIWKMKLRPDERQFLYRQSHE
jgi:hypothetical protein